ncbi:hypothetical protein FSARC_1825 [Fusarium sarcochroum]|uniref:AB hydrolase-1 domain-containing protein n=1 Tax=Fusarium sarcochroum TaxID=1208366 RepID=A0A8H4U7P1_9HYPO|nr:hypothetical protein FSARC_1825 [Fusarium sarcochroum]
MENFPDRIATLADGRKVSYAIYGIQDDNAPTCFYFHGFPGSHHEGYITNTAALKAGLRAIAVTRPGYGDSTFQKNRTLLDYPKDILELADLLSIQRFGIMGVSGGGPYAIACLKEIPRDRLVGICTIAGVMPMSFSTQGMMSTLRIMFNVAPYTPGVLGWVIDRVLGNVARDLEHPEKLEEAVNKDIEGRAPSDKEVWKNHPDLKLAVISATRAAMKQGGYATAWDAKIYGSDWGFKLEDVKFEKGQMVMFHGDQDVNVPVNVSEKAAKLMPNAELRVMKGESHMSLVTKTEEVALTLKNMLLK